MSRVVCRDMVVAADQFEGMAWLHVPDEFVTWWESMGCGEEWQIDFWRVDGRVVRGRVEWRNEGDVGEFPDLEFIVEDVLWPTKKS